MSKLVRDLTLSSAASLNIANMIGTGVLCPFGKGA
jgi:hypothetical protein